MNPLSREEFIELGITLQSDLLIQWVTRQLAATRGNEARLKSRGVDAPYLAGIGDLLATVERSQQGLGENKGLPPEASALANLIRDEALAFWREAKMMAKVEFGTRPDLLAKFRTGVQTGLLIAGLTKELDLTVALLREHSSHLAALGGTEGFIGKGDRLIRRLKDAKGNLDAACQALPPPAAQRFHDMGLLYDLTRRLVRIGQLEFMADRKQAAAFNFTGVRRKGGVSTPPRQREERVGGGKAV